MFFKVNCKNLSNRGLLFPIFPSQSYELDLCLIVALAKYFSADQYLADQIYSQVITFAS